MSTPVDLDELATALADFCYAYLITVGDNLRPHAVAVEPSFAGEVFLLTGIGRTTGRNASGHPDVTLVWPPAAPGGYSLIVDGRATLDGDSLTVAPHRAVLHRRATAGAAASPTGCADDCLPM